MSTRQIEWTEENPVKVGKNEYAKGDRTTHPKEIADEFIRLGWAKCVKTGETGERIEGAQKLRVNDAIMNTFAKMGG